jgi:hypothetical protein
MGQDAHSKTSLMSLSRYQVLDTLGVNIVNNGTFAKTIAPWSGWPVAVTTAWAANAGLDSGCMRVAYDNDSAAGACLVYPSSFALSARQAYLLRFSALSLNPTASLQVIVRQAHTPWISLGLSKYFILHNTRKDYSVVFISDSTDAQSRVDFSNTKADSVYWLDNVSVVPVRAALQDTLRKSPLFYNASAQTQVISLHNLSYHDLDGNPVAGSIRLDAFMSKILMLDTEIAAVSRLNGTERRAGEIAILSLAGGLRYRIMFVAESPAGARLALYDLRGRMVAVRNFFAKAGMNSIVWNATDCTGNEVRPGNYLAEMAVGNCRFTKRLLKVK